jgi:hypothetical protein
MGSFVRELLLLSLVAAACATSVQWHELTEPEHHVHAVKLAKVCWPAFALPPSLQASIRLFVIQADMA